MVNSTKYKYILQSVIAAFFLAYIPVTGNAQSYIETFGQNRVQHRKFDWKYFDTKHFRVYHYDRAGRDLGRYVAEEAENDIKVVEQKLGGQFPKRFNIILYNSYDEYRQTNVGLKFESQLEENTPAGSIDLVGDKLVVYFTGQHNDLHHQILTGMAQVVMERMLFGENFRKMVKNSILLNLPAWVTEGYIAYMVDGWDTRANTEWKGLLDARPKAGFNDLSEQYPELAGKAFWKFVSEQFKPGTIKTLLYMMQQKTNMNKGMKSPQTLGMKVVKAYDSCITFYKNIYRQDSLHQEQPDSSMGLIELNVPKDNGVIRNVKVSPRGHDVAYTFWKDGEYTVYLQKTSAQRELTPLLSGGRLDYNEKADPDYPLMVWSNNGYKMAILFKKGENTYLRIYDALKAKINNYKIPNNRFDRVLGMTFMEENDKLIFSAIRKSQTDLFTFTLRGSRLTNITNDLWDDVQPWYVSGGSRQGILFLSNRPKPNLNVPIGVNQLPTGPMNVYFYNTKTQSAELLQCSDFKTGHVTQPIQYGNDNFAFLYDGNGINNKYVVVFGRDKNNNDSAYAVPVTNYSENIISHQYNPLSKEVADVLQQGDQYHVFFHPVQIPDTKDTPKVLQPTILSVQKPDQQASEALGNVASLTSNGTAKTHAEGNKPEIKGGNTFQSEFADTTTQTTVTEQAAADAKTEPDSTFVPVVNDSSYMKMKAAKYRLSVKPDFFAIRLDNSLLFSQYQSFTTNGGQYSNPSLSGLATISMNDLMENHRFTAGIQLPINLSGSAYFLQYQNFTRRIDWGILYLRSQNYYDYLITYVDNANQPILQKEQLGKTVTNMVQGDLTYPFDRIRSVRFHTALREDKLTFKAQDTLSLAYDVPNTQQFWSLSRLEYVYDNTLSPILNIRYGFRFKFYAEYMYELNQANSNCYNLGLDFRYYKKLYKNFIWATRVAAAHSDGSNEVVYFLGGVDNWISPKYDNAVPVNGNYGFQTLETNLRGYDQNARNGNNFAIINEELRLPIFNTFLKRPVQSAVLKNLQFVAFVDAGSAWKGFLPNASSTAVNYQFPSPTGGQPSGLNNVYLNLTVPNSLGLALGYGAGLRTTLLGYFLRVDAAWNIDGIKKPVWYFSLGTDF